MSRLPNDFNWKVYLQLNTDLGRAGIQTNRSAINHWLRFGYKEGRKYTFEPWTQFYSNKKYHHFTETFGKNYNLTYTDNLEQSSLVYFGMEPFKFPKFNNNIIIFVGTDLLNFLKIKNSMPIILLKAFFSKNNFISISPFIHDKLKSIVPSKNLRRVNLLGSSIKNIVSYEYFRRRGEHVYIYTNLTETYNLSLLMDIYQRIRRVKPQIKFIIATNNLYYKIHNQNINRFNNSPQNRFKPYKLISVSDKNMVNVYRNTFIGLRLTQHDGNSNTVCELGTSGIKCIHNGDQPNCIPWTNIADICENILSEYSRRSRDYSEISRKTKEYCLESRKVGWNTKIFSEKRPLVQQERVIDMFTLTSLTPSITSDVNTNINRFDKLISKFKNILFICGDYPGYGGAATNCNNLQSYYKSKGHNTYGFYYNFETGTNAKYVKTSDYIVDDLQAIVNVKFKPNLIILKSPCSYDFKKMFKCPVYYLVGGIYLNNLDKYYYDIKDKMEQDKYINLGVLKQIKNTTTLTFVNSSHTQEILNKYYNLDTKLFYSSFVPFQNKKPIIDKNFSDRKYDYGLIVSNFDTRKIKNVEKSIEFLKDKDKVILIGKNSSKYKHLGFECVDLVDNKEMNNYYKQIKYIVQDSFYESCSNVKIEGLYKGCKTDINSLSHLSYMLRLSVVPGSLISSISSISKKKKTIIFVSFTRWTSGILRGYNITNCPLLQKSFNIEYFMFEGKHRKLLKYIRNSIVVFVKGNLRKLPDIKELFGENNYFIHDILDTYGDRGETFKVIKQDIKHYENCFDLLLVNSKHMKTTFINNGINKNKIKVLYHPCDKDLKLINTIEDKVNYIGDLGKCDINLELVNVSHIKFTHSMNRSIHFTYVEEDNIFSHFHTSTKLATCIKLKSILVSNKIPIFVELLGNKYPFFIDNIDSIKKLSIMAKKLLINNDDYIIFYNKYYKPLEPILLDNANIYNDLFNSINIPQYNSKVCFKAYFIDNLKKDNEIFKQSSDIMLKCCDYYIYTNSKRSFLDFLPYKKIYYDIKTKKHCLLFSRYIKWAPHILFNTYTYSIYMDCYFDLIKTNEDKYNEIFGLLTKNNNIIVDKHKCRKNIIEEINYLIYIYHKQSSDPLKIIKETSYNLTNLLRFIDTFDNKNEIVGRELSQNGVIFTLIQPEEKAKNIFDMLTYIFNTFTHRDQCSLQIVTDPQIYPGLQKLFLKGEYKYDYRR